MDCVSPILNIATRLWDCAANRAVFIRELEENLEGLRNKRRELQSINQDVRTRIRLAEQQHKQPKPQVSYWLETVEKMDTEVNKILQNGDQVIQQRCLGSHCPKNCCLTYKIGKKVVRTLGVVGEQVKIGREFGDVANDMPRLSVEERPMEKTVGLDSMFDDTWRWINKENIGIIGLWGLGGVGKTTLMRNINNEFCKPCHKIDKVVWVEVLNKSAEDVQKDIARKLGLSTNSWDEMDGDERVLEIYRVLKDKRFVLLLDDIRNRINVFSLGVPHPSSESKSKILFTTRSEAVCGHIEAHKRIRVKCLSPLRALELFREKVGYDTLDSHPQIPQLAESIAKECDGLPLALITIGRAMAYKRTVREWDYGLKMLKECPSKIPGMDEHVFSKLKFSYDSLCSENIKSCFLYCCIFPEAYNIPIEELLWLWIGEGLLTDSRTIDEAIDDGKEIISNLKEVCLLESGENEDYVKMHDVIRDMALSVARKKKEYIFVIEGMAINGRNMAEWEEAKRISMWNVKSIDSSCSRTYSGISTLLVSRNKYWYDPPTLPRGFLRCMPAIKVLDFEKSGLKHVPSAIGSLVSLQHLSFSRTLIESLPGELKNLTNLRSLHLERIRNLVSISREVIPGLLMLKVLRIFGTEIKIVGNNLSSYEKSLLEDFECLQHLEYATLTITTVHDVRNVQNSHNLQSITRAVGFKLREGSSVSFSSFRSMSCLENVRFHACESLELITFNQNEQKREGLPPDNILNLNFSSYDQCLKNLHRVTISYCRKLRNMTWLIWATNVKELFIECCDSMEEVIGESDIGVVGLQNDQHIFPRLEMLCLCRLANLRSIYKHVLPFPFFKVMRVIECPNLKKLPFDSQSAKNSLRKLTVDRQWWDELEWDDSTTRDAFYSYVRFVSD